MIQNKKILIAGGNGFIGTNLSIKLIHQMNDVTIIDNYCTSKNKFSFWYKCGAKVIREDIINYSTDEDYDIIINLACAASPKKYQSDPMHTLDTCYIGTKKLLSLMGPKTIFLQASTSEIYGDPLVAEQSEDYFGNTNCFGERSCYDEGKRIAETLCYEKIKQGYNVKIARIFNTYGPHMDIDDGRVITNLISQVMNNEPLTIYGDGKQTRSFQYIDDLLDGLEKLIESNINTPVNLGNPNEEVTMLELVDIILNVLNKSHSYPVIFEKFPSDDPKIRKPNIEKANINLNWRPTISLKEGIKKTYNYLCSNMTI